MQEQGRHRHNVMESDMGEQWVTSNEDAVMSGGRNGYNQKWMHNSHGQPHNQQGHVPVNESNQDAAGNDINSLAWMAPDFDLEELI